jgi:hypothetical protein
MFFKNLFYPQEFELLNGKFTFGIWIFCNWTFASGRFVGVPWHKATHY